MSLTEARLIEHLRQETGLEELHVDTPLFSSGAIDSVGMIDLILFIETEARVEVRQEDVTLANFDSVRRIVALLGQKAA